MIEHAAAIAQRTCRRKVAVKLVPAFIFTFAAFAQDGPPANAVGAFPSWPKSAPEVIARGKQVYLTNCAYCHGEDARGGENGGTNIIRSDVFMKDRRGEVVAEFLKTTDSNEHKFRFTGNEAAEIAAFIHAFGINGRDPGRMRPPTIVVGDPKAGQSYFQSKCAGCHSAEGDLKGIAARISNPRALQQTWLMPVVPGGRGPVNPGNRYHPITVTVTLPEGKVEGVLGRIDDFLVTITQSDGTRRTIRRDGNSPPVEIHDPMKGHKDLLPQYSDRDIHNLTAYLVTLR
jgi:cytochrome c oxidase cbb3-type subunit 3